MGSRPKLELPPPLPPPPDYADQAAKELGQTPAKGSRKRSFIGAGAPASTIPVATKQLLGQ